MSDSQNQQDSGGAGSEGTIPDSDAGLAAGVADGSGTTFEPEEDPAGATGADGSGDDADGKPRPDSHNAETNEDTVSGGPA
jgi:hypothetical protein